MSITPQHHYDLYRYAGEHHQEEEEFLGIPAKTKITSQ
jgi:hypothetical protein